jgi:two-component sensor histidine kinase
LRELVAAETLPEGTDLEALLKYLPGPQPVAIRYGATAALVFLAYGIRLALGDYSGAYGFLFFILPVVASALMFDRGTGFFAIALSGLLVATIVNWGVKPGAHIIALLLFAVVGACLVLISEGLHRALGRAYAAQSATALLLEEMSHRVKNKFAMVSSIISLQARRSSPEVRQALEDIASRVNIIATVHNYLQLSRHEGLIDMSEYLPRLCESLDDALLGPRAVSLRATAAKIELPPDKALSIGVIVNELVTNAIKYAFGDGQAGQVHVDLDKEQERLVLTVRDNGCGYAPSAEAGLGTRLVTTFAAQLGGSATWSQSRTGGCTINVVFPA